MQRLIQKIFFPALCVRPRIAWKQAYPKVGTVEDFVVSRRAGNISCLRVKATKRHYSDKVAILAHPLSPKAKYFFSKCDRIKSYVARDYDVIVFDFNGFGESDSIDFRYWLDCESVIKAIGAKAIVRHVVLHGLSFGAYHAGLAINALPSNASLVLENVSRSMYDYWRRRPITRLIIRVVQRFNPSLMESMDLIRQLSLSNRSDVALLLIGCEDDQETPVMEMRDVFDCYTGKKQFTVIENAAHWQAQRLGGVKYDAALNSICV